ncbi:MAG: hypothetical protein HETSPECPRED_000495 [Heterodermia speciosa]|uniref:Uncharacterized protein n=1 Tax=Heterodermia speciosa TaxID=116794 RepID=A0A8H3G6A4_9LECA|nr:MAG: hypothetical protein HETSPECPRED_000495 [Heterodermia speciosa]
MTKKNTLELGDKIRKGTMFRTPLSQTSCSDTKAKTDMIHRLQEYIETRFDDENYEDLSEGEKPSTYLVPSLCEGQKLALEWDRLFRYPKIPLCFVRPYFSDSYDDIRSSLRGKDVEEKFCEQLSDQLVFCEECGQRPILFNVIRDEDSMKRHFGGDKRENEVLVKKVEEMRKTLLWKLGGPEFQPYKKDTNRKRTEPE